MKKITFNIFALGSIIFFVWLGLWQVERLKWKENLLWQLEKYQDSKPVEFSILNHDPINHLYKKVFLFGKFLHDEEILLAAKYFSAEREKKEIGYHVVTPFLTSEGIVVLVNRGWIPEEMKDQETRKQSLISHNMEIPLVGIIRKSSGKAPWFMPQNMPERNIWFWLDIPVIIDFLEAKEDIKNLRPVLIQQTNVTSYEGFEYPIPVSEEIKLKNDHMYYAITWFLIAFATLGMWYFWLRKQEQEKPAKQINKSK